MALCSTQPLKEMSTRGVKEAGGKADNLTTLHVPIVMKYGSLNLLDPSGPVQACNGIALPLPLILCFFKMLLRVLVAEKSVVFSWLVRTKIKLLR